MKKDIKIFATTIDGKAINQIYELANSPAFENSKIRIMPDCHPGEGCVVGFTGTYTDKIIPNVVGSDLSCGMLTIELGKIDIDLSKLDKFIKENIPMGHNINDLAYKNCEMMMFKKDFENLHCYNYLKNKEELLSAIGSLGGGNHFIEIDVDEEGNKYLVIHSGSRNLGTQVAKYYQNLAIKECKESQVSDEEIREIADKLKKQNRQVEIPEAIQEYREEKQCKEPKLAKELCYLEGKSMQDYLDDIVVCKEFANMSRRYMAERIIEHIFNQDGVGKDICGYVDKSCETAGYDDERISIHLTGFETLHNYVDIEESIIRKGAIRALESERVLIPINMRDGSLICIGKGNEDYNYSAPHGAGRLMSRSEAKEILDLKKFEDTMKNVYTSSVNESTLDESPFVYKSMEEILNNIKDTVTVEKIIKPIYNCKASE